MRFICFLLLISLVPLCAIGQEEPMKFSRVKIDLSSISVKAISELGLESDHGDYVRRRHLINDYSAAEIRLLESAGIPFEIQIEDVMTHYKEQNHAGHGHDHTQGLRVLNNCDGNTDAELYHYQTPQNYAYGSMGGYLTYDELLSTLDDMVALFPDLISSKTPIGSALTHEGRPIHYLRLSDNPNTQESEPEVLYTALHHAREPNSLSQMIFYMWYLLENYESDPEIQYLIDNTQMYFVPCVNPDGYVYNELIAPDGGGLWRKNRYAQNGTTYGVDLNRNYGFEWAYNSSGSSPNPSSNTYRGPSAFSEPETKAIRDLCNAHSFKICLNHHTYGNLLIYPWGYSDQVTSEDEAFSSLADVMTKENDFLAGTGTETVGYTVNGDSDDWMYGETDSKPAIYSMTPETGPGSFGFWPPQSAIDQLNKSSLQMNLKAAHLLLNYGEAKEILGQEEVSTLDGTLDIQVKKHGLEPGVLTVTVAGLENVMSVVPLDNNSWSMDHLQEESISFDYSLASGILHGDEIRFLVSVDNGSYFWTDTLVKQFNGTISSTIYSDDGDDLGDWSRTGDWGLAFNTFVSSPSCYADSPDGEYDSDQNSSMTLADPIDLSEVVSAELNFYAKWNIENNYDYVQVMASIDGVNFNPLCGLYTNPGSGFQVLDDPLYDGEQGDWVQEKIDLEEYVGQESVWIRFTFFSDGLVEEDGFYFDGLQVKGVLDSENCPADLNGDGVVDIADFLIFNSAFGSSCVPCPADFNEDGLVDISDFLIFNSAFGSICP